MKILQEEILQRDIKFIISVYHSDAPNICATIVDEGEKQNVPKELKIMSSFFLKHEFGDHSSVNLMRKMDPSSCSERYKSELM